jgi:hypothetical protein
MTKKIKEPLVAKETVKQSVPKGGKIDTKYLPSKSKHGFKFLAGIQRDIKPDQTNKLHRSILRMGIVRPVMVADLDFITGKTETYLVDGQHLYTAATREEDIVIPYLKIPIKDKQDLVETIAMLNASSLSWTMNDYMQAWGSLKPDYVTLNKAVERYDIECRVAGACFMPTVNTGTMLTVIKRGQFEISDEVKGYDSLQKISDCLKTIYDRGSRLQTRTLSTALLTIIKNDPNYDQKKLLVYLKNHKTEVQLMTENKDVMIQYLQKAFA